MHKKIQVVVIASLLFLSANIASAASPLTLSLSRGMKNDQVKQLQLFLASQPDIYPEGTASGYFGVLTEKALKKWQKEKGLDPLGIVGPKTRVLINRELVSEGGGSVSQAAAVPNSTSVSSGQLSTSTVISNAVFGGIASSSYRLGARITNFALMRAPGMPGWKVAISAEDPTGLVNITYTILSPTGSIGDANTQCYFKLAVSATCTFNLQYGSNQSATTLGTYNIGRITVEDGAGYKAVYGGSGTLDIIPPHAVAPEGKALTHNIPIPVSYLVTSPQ